MMGTITTDRELIERAKKRYFKICGNTADQPSDNSDVNRSQERKLGWIFITLRNVNGRLARFRYDTRKNRMVEQWHPFDWHPDEIGGAR